MSDELARRIHGKRQTCPNRAHGKRYMAYDLNSDGWNCQGEGEHEIDRTRPEGYPDNMLADMKRLGIDPAGDPT